MPTLPVCLFEPLWVQCSALLPERPRVSPTHPLGSHRGDRSGIGVLWIGNEPFVAELE